MTELSWRVIPLSTIKAAETFATDEAVAESNVSERRPVSVLGEVADQAIVQANTRNTTRRLGVVIGFLGHDLIHTLSVGDTRGVDDGQVVVIVVDQFDFQLV